MKTGFNSNMKVFRRAFISALSKHYNRHVITICRLHRHVLSDIKSLEGKDDNVVAPTIRAPLSIFHHLRNPFNLCNLWFNQSNRINRCCKQQDQCNRTDHNCCSTQNPTNGNHSDGRSPAARPTMRTVRSPSITIHLIAAVTTLTRA